LPLLCSRHGRKRGCAFCPLLCASWPIALRRTRCRPCAAAQWGYGKGGAAAGPREAAGEAKDSTELVGEWDAGSTWKNVVQPVFRRAFKELCGKPLAPDLTPQV